MLSSRVLTNRRRFGSGNCEEIALNCKRTGTRVRCISLRGARMGLAVSAAFFLIGILLGHGAAQRCAASAAAELERYLESFLALRTEAAPSFRAVSETVLCFLRAPAAVFLLGFASLGIVLIPCVCALQGFLFSFSLFCFAAALGRDGFFALAVLFAARLLVVLPCTMLLSGEAMETSYVLAALSLGGGKRARPADSGRRRFLRFGKVCVCLLLAAAAELWLSARILPLLL